MSKKRLQKPDYLFETSWEVCNKVGGIHTVISTKALSLEKELKNTHVVIGPDVWRDAGANPEFNEEPNLWKAWKLKAAEEGLRIRIGRWNIAGKPIAILVDFTPFFSQKDDILKHFWEQYKLDSITGQWDYLEPVLFGYASGKVIESFTKFYLSPGHKILAHFHEWMTGSGLLYLKSRMPRIGCIFTTHATVLGRCIAGNNLPLYDKLESYNPDDIAREFNVISKQSMEKLSAQNADCFTTVSEITANECKHFLGKEVDLITPNGFEPDFVPVEKDFEEKRKEARKKMIDVASILLNREVADDALLVCTSGRYEFKNKGLDVFIKALSELDKTTKQNKEILAFIMVPAGHQGPVTDLQKKLADKSAAISSLDPYITHVLREPQFDPVLKTIHEVGLTNKDDKKVKIFFVPSYLNGSDGIFNMPYYDLLIGFDLTVFASYYEPWGYTPLESVAFKVPTVTTTLAGFGLWVNDNYTEAHPGVRVIERNDSNDDYVVKEISNSIDTNLALTPTERKKVNNNAEEVSTIALWENLIDYYYQAFNFALQQVNQRYKPVTITIQDNKALNSNAVQDNIKPVFREIIVQRNIPKKLATLEELSKNLWWCWNIEVINLFNAIDPDAWRRSEYNPIAFLDSIPYDKYQKLEKDPAFVNQLNGQYARFKAYMDEKKSMKGPHVAYFSMEYGLHPSLKIYSGGLGILAGDYLKEASDKATRMTGVGLLYRYGYFTQKLSAAGDQVSEYEAQNFSKIPVTPVRDKEGNLMIVTIGFPGRSLYARVWKVEVGRTDLYLLDTDFDDNQPADRTITHHLYGGDWENRLKQELLLGVGGIRLLDQLGVKANVYHCNEGHAAFIGVERLRELIMEKNLNFDEALEVVRSSSLFTTHTPVPAGHDSFSEDLLRTYLPHYPERLGITWEKFMSLGKVNYKDPNEKFSMSFLAANLSQEVNGVSKLHGEVSREIFKGLYPGYLPEELHISYVTNGVHFPTWTATEFKDLYNKYFGEAFAQHNYDREAFKKIQTVNDSEIWDIRNILRNKLVTYIKERFSNPMAIIQHTPRQIVEMKETLNGNHLTIGFARRFATYKRAHLLFRNLDRLNQIVNNPERPVQFLFAGKAHPADKAGQDLIKRIVEISKYPQFLGKIIFLENYDMELARRMVKGVDIWLNTPTRPLEASGTSGEKAVMSGALHFSVLDGWWVEGYQPGAGWMLPEEATYDNNDFQDELDSETIYNILEDEIAPLFYNRNVKGVPEGWVSYIKNSIEKVASNFTTNRMLIDYEDRFYFKLNDRYRNLCAKDYEKAREIAAWKQKVTRAWDDVKIISAELPNISSDTVLSGKEYSAKVEMCLGSLSPQEVGVEIVVVEQVKDKTHVISKQEFKLYSNEGGVAVYAITSSLSLSGIYLMGLRIFPKNPALPHRQDFPLVKWI